jgi:hypothetical protein
MFVTNTYEIGARIHTDAKHIKLSIPQSEISDFPTITSPFHARVSTEPPAEVFSPSTRSEGLTARRESALAVRALQLLLEELRVGSHREKVAKHHVTLLMQTA